MVIGIVSCFQKGVPTGYSLDEANEEIVDLLLGEAYLKSLILTFRGVPLTEKASCLQNFANQSHIPILPHEWYLS